jgi:hypothetical protein
MRGGSAGLVRVLAWTWLALVPFAVHAWPYLHAEASGLAGRGVAALTVDEPVYVVHVDSLVAGDPPETNPWTRERGPTASPYRYFPGSLLPLAAWTAAGGSTTVGLGVVAGLFAAACAALAAFLLRRGGVGPAAAVVLAPTVVLLPWNRIGGLLRGQWTAGVDRNALLPLMRPFTSQAGPTLFLAAAAAFVAAAAPGPRRRLLLPALAVVALFHTFPYGVPVVLVAAGVAALAARVGRPRSGRLLGAVAIAGAALVPSAIGYLGLVSPQEGEVDPVRSDLGAIGKSTVVLLAAAAAGLVVAVRRRDPRRAAAPLLGLSLALGMAASAALPFHLQVDNHLFYLYGPVLALVVLPWVAPALGRAPRAGAAVVVALGLASGIGATAACLRGARPEVDDHARMVEVLRAAPTPPGHLLLVEGAALNGWGGWAPLYTDVPLLYSYDGEHAPTPSLEDRQDRRAWYHYFLGLRSEDVPARTRESLYAYKRLAGALVYTARPEVFEAMEDRIRQMERGAGPSVDRFRRHRGLVVVDAADAPLFSRERLEARGRLVESRTVGRHVISTYEIRVGP